MVERMSSQLETQIIDLLKTSADHRKFSIDKIAAELRASKAKVRNAIHSLIEAKAIRKDASGNLTLDTGPAKTPNDTFRLNAAITSEGSGKFDYGSKASTKQDVTEEVTIKRLTTKSSNGNESARHTVTGKLQIIVAVTLVISVALLFSLWPKSEPTSLQQVSAKDGNPGIAEKSASAASKLFKPELPLNQDPVADIQLDLIKLQRSAPYFERPEDYLRAINGVIREGEKLEKNVNRNELFETLATLYFDSGKMQFVLDRRAATESFHKAIFYLEKLQATSEWKLSSSFGVPTDEQHSLANWIANARVMLSFLSIMDANSGNHPDAHQLAREKLKNVRIWLESDITKNYAKVRTCQRVAIAYWYLGDTAKALEMVDLATAINGTPRVAKSHGKQTLRYELDTIGLRSAILASAGKSADSLHSIASAADFAGELKGEDNQGFVGTLYFIHAVHCENTEAEKESLEKARDYYRFHGCESCLFGDAVAAARLAEIEESGGNTELAEKLREISAFTLSKAIPMYRTHPLRLDLNAIKAITCLQPVIARDDVKAAFQFSWEPQFVFDELEFAVLFFHLPPYEHLSLPFHTKLIRESNMASCSQ